MPGLKWCRLYDRLHGNCLNWLSVLRVTQITELRASWYMTVCSQNRYDRTTAIMQPKTGRSEEMPNLLCSLLRTRHIRYNEPQSLPRSRPSAPENSSCPLALGVLSMTWQKLKVIKIRANKIKICIWVSHRILIILILRYFLSNWINFFSLSVLIIVKHSW